MHVFNVPASAPFLRTVIAALVDGRLVDGFEARQHPENLANATLYLPTRRATRLAREVFLDVLNTEAAILPRLVALGDIDEDELVFAQAASNAPATALELLPAIDGLERRLTLAQLIVAWARQLKPADPASAPLVTSGPASTLALADDLARLMDDMQTRKVPWEALDTLVPEEHDKYWQLTLGFLKIAREAWPQHLQEIGRIEPSARRDLLIAAEAARLTAHDAGPVIAAGSTGSMPSTAALLQVIAKLPRGAVVLPGLDTELDDESWATIGGAKNAAGVLTSSPASSHPQFAMHALLGRFGISRKAVKGLPPNVPLDRAVLTSEAMRPSDTTALWRDRLKNASVAKRITQGMQGIAVIEAANVEMEALAIAVAMREAQHMNITAALVTPDRALARRVLAALGRWELACNDSGGDSLMETPAGLFARLVATVAAEQVAPASLLALLKHPLMRLGRREGALRRVIADLELALLRGTRPPPGLDGLRRSFDNFRAELAKLRRREESLLHHSELRTRISESQLDAVAALLDDLSRAIAPLTNVARNTEYDFATLARLHRGAVEQLSTDERASVLAFEGSDGEALLAAFDDEALKEGAPHGLMVRIDDYGELFETAFAGKTVRRAERPSALLHIYGQLEARLSHCQRVILGGLTEGVWPPDARSDPWLSRPMRREIGLDLPERRIGLSAHDFTQLLGSPEVVLTHAAKVGGAPAVASRFLHRLKAVAGDDRWDAACEAGSTYLRLAEELDRPQAAPKPVPQPAPKPPVSARPLALSVTQIEDWLRDPYTIYARHILDLSPLDPVDMPLSAADRGSAIHGAIGDFTLAFPEALPANPEVLLCEIGEKRFAPLMDRPEARALWWPRFRRIAAWFAGWEQSRRDGLLRLLAEVRGSMSIPLGPDRAFTLSARADRIEQRAEGFAVLDYKTGAPPTDRQVRIGLAPQLTLTAAILRAGGFPEIDAGSSVCELTYVRLSGNVPPGEPRRLELRDKRSDPPMSPNDAAREAHEKLAELVRRFDDEAQAYNSLNLSMWRTRYGDYDNLARIKEWSATQGTIEEIP
jgi:ATP-dependent helicase/nuclease subunit B